MALWMRKHLELKRQLFHLIIGTIFAVLIYYKIIDWLFIGLLLILLILVAAIHKRAPLRGLSWLLYQLERPKVIPGAGAIQMTFGILITILIFRNPAVVAAAILILAWGDSVSTYIGKKYGEIKLTHNKRKSLEGSLAGFLAAFIASQFVVGLELAFLGSFVGMFFESFNDRVGLDDNIIIPVAAAMAMTLAL